ncbi:MAG: HAMP domain-containing sensor histidine kinase [Lachnospiraceae bacterium]|nr:HAMP domain-containing sensor histidine kinase [Lachnospiraceae bacterium]
MGIKKTTSLKILFRRFAISLIVLLIAALAVPFGLETLAVNVGLATRANYSELQAKEIIPTLAVAPDITKVVIPQRCDYLILDKDFNELFSNMNDRDKDAAVLYAKGEYIEHGTNRKFTLVVREKELCILQYFIGSQFTVSWLPKWFPSPDVLTFILMAINFLVVIIVLTAMFAKNLKKQLSPLFEATAEVAQQNLEFEVQHSKIAEFEDVLLSFDNMKDSLKKALEQQWKAEQIQREQIAALAHDLKTPLTIIQGNADLIGETKLDIEQRQYADYIIESSEKMQVYIKTLIDLSRAMTGYQFFSETIDFPTYLEQLIVQMKNLCHIKEINLKIEITDIPQEFIIDKSLFERAVMNILNNALYYSPQGGTIYVNVSKKNSHVQIAISDEGKGFSPEALCHAKEQFYMADRSRNSEMHFGMGLYIANSIVEQHGGQLTLENSAETGGGKVTIQIPC